MPENNRFRHQSYPTQPAVEPTFHNLNVADVKDIDFHRLHTELGVTQVIVVHGTFLGGDPFAVSESLLTIADNVRPLSESLTSLAVLLRDNMKPFTDRITGDVSNYSTEFRDDFQRLVGSDPTVQLLHPTWSGQNHHLARTDLAMRLLCQLDDLQPTSQERILFWGHSHAGNGFAILSNLLANDRGSVSQLFDAAGPQPGAHWDRARRILLGAETPHRWAKSVLIVTFGTPVRYGWDLQGCRHLIHVLHHRNYAERNPIVTKSIFPPYSLSDTLSAKYGDWVQSFAIAGTDVAAPTAIRANEHLAKLLETGLPEPDHSLDTRFLPSHFRNVCARWKTGTRCHADGLNLLVKYEPSGHKTGLGMPLEESVLGHGVATTRIWLPRHLGLVMDTLRSTAD